MQISLPEEHVDVLRDVLENALGAVRMEISHTDNPEFKKGLRLREEALRAVLGQLRADQ